jgi:hypothetical protein
VQNDLTDWREEYSMVFMHRDLILLSLFVVEPKTRLVVKAPDFYTSDFLYNSLGWCQFAKIIVFP